MTCPDCKGTGEYVGLIDREPCRTCSVPTEPLAPCPRKWKSVAITCPSELWYRWYSLGYVSTPVPPPMGKIEIKV